MRKRIVLPCSFKYIEEVVCSLEQGDLVVFPTETVYGVAVNAEHDNAIQKVYHLKKRDLSHPLTIHIGSIEVAEKYAIFSNQSLRLANKFWPGALTLVLPLKTPTSLSLWAMPSRATVALRIPCGICLDVLQQCSFGIAMPSANLSGMLSPSCPEHISSEILSEVAYFFDSGICSIGIESTILDMTSFPPRILRPGPITCAELESVLESKISIHTQIFGKPYILNRRLRCDAFYPLKNEAWLGFGDIYGCHFNLSKKNNLEEAAQNLYSMLRLLDEFPGKTGICVSPIPYYGIGVAINDRLRRAQFS